MPEDFDMRSPDTFVTGTVGPPGQRIFFLQASEAGHVVSLKLEKGQVWALAHVLGELLEAEDYDGPQADYGDLLEPVSAAWTVGRIASGLDTEHKIIMVILDEIDDSDSAEGEEGEDPPELEEPAEVFSMSDEGRSLGRARFELEFSMAAGFVHQALLLVEEGRDFGMRNGHRPPQG